MQKVHQQLNRLIVVCLTIVMVATLFIPMGSSVAYAAAEGFILDGYPLDCSTPTSDVNYDTKTKGCKENPILHYESYFSFSGTYPVGIVGENLRLKINDIDQGGLRPEVDKDNLYFRFRDIALIPGTNIITMYEKDGDKEKDGLLESGLYVQYVNTPALSDIRVGSTPLASDPTVVELNSERNLTVSIYGRATNADSVVVENLTTKKSFSDGVSKSGGFAVNVDMQVGINKFNIRAYNKNKEIMLLEKNIVITISGSGQGAMDQFYDATLENNANTSSGKIEPLLPDKVPVIISSDTAANDSLKLSGQLMIKSPSDITPFATVVGATITPVTEGTVTVQDLSNPNSTISSSFTATYLKDLPGDYKLYSIVADIDEAAANFWNDNHKYQIQLSYDYAKSSATGPTQLKASVNYFKYQFSYYNKTSPRFISITNKKENKLIVEGTSPNLFRVSPLELTFKTANMDDVSKFSIFYGNTKLTTGDQSGEADDYDIETQSDEEETTITLKKLPPAETLVKVVYSTGVPAKDPTVNFVLKPEVTPYVQLFDVASQKYIDSQLQITSKITTDPFKLKAKISNYAIRSNSIKVTLQNSSGTAFSRTYSASEFDIDLPRDAILEGNNLLTISLTQDPNAVFKYNILYSVQEVPEIKDLKLRIRQNNKEEELVKKASDPSYRTSSVFLSEISFEVPKGNADEVTIKKDGNAIAKFTKNASGNWVKSNLSIDADLQKGSLETIYNNTNFDERSNIFSAEMSTRDGEDLLDELSRRIEPEKYDAKWALFPLTLKKGGDTSYEIEVKKGNIYARQKVVISQETHAWEVIEPTKSQNAKYILVNANSTKVKVFAEKANKVIFGKTEATVRNTTVPDYRYDQDLEKSIPQTYYVFEASVPLKPGLNKVKFTVEIGSNRYNDEIEIYNVNSAVDGAVSTDLFGKKLSFTAFEKALDLKFPSGTVLLSPSSNRKGQEARNPKEEIFTDVPIYFAIADRTNGKVSLDEDDLSFDFERVLRPDSEFNYASPLYYIDAGDASEDIKAPGGRDPYTDIDEDDSPTGHAIRPFIDRWRDNLVPSKSGTLSIKYDPSIVNAANNILTVFYNDGNEWKNLGGVVDTGKKVVTVPFRGFGYYMVMKTRESFSDVITHEFARDAIETLYAKGIMNDAPGAGFGTERKITRGEFATMIVKALDLPINAGPYSDYNEKNPVQPTFNDVYPDLDDWDFSYKYIETAARAGIIRGKDTRSFYPYDPLTREEAAIIIARALNLKTGTPEASKQALGKMFTDAQLTGHYAAASVLAVTKAKIMNGEPNDPTAKKPTYRFNPTGDLTRAEMAVITIRIMTQLKKLPK